MRRARRCANRGDAVEPPAVAGRRQGQREAGQHDEHDDREPPVDEPAGPERRPVHRVAGERAQEDVVHHHEQRGQAADAVQAGQPLSRRRATAITGRSRVRAERAEEAVAEGAHRPDRRLRARAAGRPASPTRRSGLSTAGSWAMTEIGTSWLAPWPLTIVRGLMVAQDDEHEVRVAVVLHEGDQRAQRVLDRLAVRRAHAVRGRSRARPSCDSCAGIAVEDRAVADLVPGDQLRDAASTACGSTRGRSRRTADGGGAWRARGVAGPTGRTGRASRRRRSAGRGSRRCGGRRPCRSGRRTSPPARSGRSTARRRPSASPARLNAWLSVKRSLSTSWS